MVAVKFEVPTRNTALKSIETAMAGPTANDYFAAAQYYYQSNADQAKALEWMNQAIAKTPNGKVSVSIYDMKGRKIYEEGYTNYTQTSLQVNTAQMILARGIYSVKVDAGGKIYNLKAMK